VRYNHYEFFEKEKKMKNVRMTIWMMIVVAILTVKPTLANMVFDTFLVVNDGINPKVSGNNIVYYRTGPSGGLYYRNIWGTGIGSQVDCDFNITGGRDQIDFSGDIITYTHYDQEYIAIQTVGGYKIGAFGAVGSDHPRVDNGRVVYHGRRGTDMGIHSIYCYTVDTGNLEVVYEWTTSQMNPDISDNVVVWSDFVTFEGGRIGIYDFSTDTFTFTNLVKPPFHHYHPVVGGNIVVWEDGAYDLSTSTYIDVLSGNNPAISGDTIVYEKNGGIYGYNINNTQSEFMLSQYGSYPHIDGNIVVWEQGGGIYGAIIPEPATLLLLGFGSLALLRKQEGGSR
jgi:hypothetical protein